VANKNANTIAKGLEKLLQHGRKTCNGTPFEIVRHLADTQNFPELLRSFGFGCFNKKAEYLLATAKCGLDIRTCTVEDLEAIHGVGMKTARYFILHSRKNARVACLDTHVLKWLSYYTGYSVSTQTPTRKDYLRLELIFLRIADVMLISPADLDLKIWNKSRGSDEKSLVTNSRTEKKKVLDSRV
jgi:thermostable 8-oxoguanine DNA glycosylase